MALVAGVLIIGFSESEGGFVFGLLLLLVGLVVVLVGVIATGVRLGMAAHARDERSRRAVTVD